MEQVIVVENLVDAQCVRHVHLLSNRLIEDCVLQSYAPCGTGRVTQEIGAWHFRAEYPYRGVLDVACVGNEKRFRRLVVWSLAGYARATQALFI